MLRIKDDKRKSEPPGGWMDIEPVSKRCIRSGSLQGLVNEEIQFLVRNGRGAEITKDFGFIIEDRIAQSLPAGWAYDPDKPAKTYVPSPKKASIGLNIVAKKTERVRDLWERTGRKHVPTVVAAERAAQCVGCEMNRNVGCLTCNGVYQRMQSFMGKLGTAYDKRIQSCAADGVFLKVKVWMTEATLKAAIPSFARPRIDHFPEECWHRRILAPTQLAIPTPTAAAPVCADNQAAPATVAEPPPCSQTSLAVSEANPPASDNTGAASLPPAVDAPKKKRSRKRKAAPVA